MSQARLGCLLAEEADPSARAHVKNWLGLLSGKWQVLCRGRCLTCIRRQDVRSPATYLFTPIPLPPPHLICLVARQTNPN